MKKVEASLGLRMFVIWVALSLLLFGLDHLGVFRGLRAALEMVLVPIERSTHRLSSGLRTPVEMVRFWRTGTARIADLERQVAELTVDSARLVGLEEENASMKKLLNAPLPHEWSFIPAPIVGRGEGLQLGVGSRDGVEVGEMVVWSDLLLGVIVETSERQSRARLLTDPGSKIPVYLPSSGADGLLEGKFGSQMVLTQVLQSRQLDKDEPVVTSGAFGPSRGLVVGKLSDIISDETDVYQEALVTPIVDIESLTTVFVVKGNGN